MPLLFDDKLSAAIKSLLSQESHLRIAVAFVGDGASQWINPQAKDVKIICSLAMNGTNPSEVQNLIGRFGAKNVKQIDNLHAKLYIGSEYAIVGSANMSANGLGTQPTGLREAGYKFNLDQPSGQRSLDWFDDVLWEGAREISDQDLKDAAEKWRRRDRVRNGESPSDLRNICNYNFDSDDFPLINWFSGEAWSVSDEVLEGKSVDQREKIEDDIGCSVDIECSEDIKYLGKNRQIYCFKRIKSGLAAKKINDAWAAVSSGINIENAYYADEEPHKKIDVMLCDELPGAIFGLDQQSIYEKFRDLINTDKYHQLRNYANKDEQCWFHPRIELMRQFWKELQSQICQK